MRLRTLHLHRDSPPLHTVAEREREREREREGGGMRNELGQLIQIECCIHAQIDPSKGEVNQLMGKCPF